MLKNLALITGLLMTAGAMAGTPESPLTPTSPQFETVEEATESLANRMLDLAAAARGGDARDVGPFLTERIRLRLPTKIGSVTTEWKLLDIRFKQLWIVG